MAEIDKINYQPPQIKDIDILAEGVLCSSNERLDENEGEW